MKSACPFKNGDAKSLDPGRSIDAYSGGMAKVEHHPAARLVSENLVSHRIVSREHFSRAFGYLDRIAREAEQSRLTVGAVKVKHGEHVLGLTLNSRTYRVSVRETEVYMPWTSDYKTTAKAGLLQIRVQGPGVSDKHFYETKTIALEKRIPLLFKLIHDVQPSEDLADERRRLWAVEMEEQRAAWKSQELSNRLYATREKILLDAHSRWVRANDLRDYLASLEKRVELFDGNERESADEWLRWISAYIERIDPTHDELKLPGAPE